MNLKELCERVDKMEDRQTNLENALMNLATKQDIKASTRWPWVANALLLGVWLASAVVARCEGQPLPPLPVSHANAAEAQ